MERVSKDETVERNIRSRSGIRTSVTNIIKGVEAELVKDEPCFETSLDKLEILMDKEASLQKLESIINEQGEITELELEVGLELEYSDSITRCKSRIQRFIDKHRRGGADKVISGLTLSNENYDKAVEILKDGFGQKQSVISAYMNTLLKLQLV
ncbi:DUF1758 domain-containing protein [Nephila pilipes]|uniref:DUF1758 domain-containing protein n=1 Tax=Nephila pilipes TaxID=299642 RepID=A0A8X6MSI1_NEPPI|nr:DUF1758 domain-containing protein [Nephila pilipes]